jgi:hypothetical protein
MEKNNCTKYYITLIGIFIIVNCQLSIVNCSAQPKLVIGIVADMMQHDYLEKYWYNFSDSGFKKLVNNGFVFTNAHYNYIPTYTGPGHACIYTGATPSRNGIIANDWYDRNAGRAVNCVSDTVFQSVGTNSIAGRRSPLNLLSSKVTNELRKSNPISKVISIALKDRGAILPGGHLANAAYWYDAGNWITSNYYMKELPDWVKQFNSRNLVDSLLQFPWTTMLPMASYSASSADETPYEGVFKGEAKPLSPFRLTLMTASARRRKTRAGSPVWK